MARETLPQGLSVPRVLITASHRDGYQKVNTRGAPSSPSTRKLICRTKRLTAVVDPSPRHLHNSRPPGLARPISWPQPGPVVGGDCSASTCPIQTPPPSARYLSRCAAKKCKRRTPLPLRGQPTRVLFFAAAQRDAARQHTGRLSSPQIPRTTTREDAWRSSLGQARMQRCPTSTSNSPSVIGSGRFDCGGGMISLHTRSSLVVEHETPNHIRFCFELGQASSRCVAPPDSASRCELLGLLARQKVSVLG
jgi:hypothetical protein